MGTGRFSGQAKHTLVTVTTASLLLCVTATVVLASVLAVDDRPEWELGGGEGTHIIVGKPSRTSFGEVRIYHDSSIHPLVTIPAPDAQDGFGIFTSAIGDLDSDGVDDLVVGAPFNNDFATSAGAVFVFSSGTGEQILQIPGEGPFVELGRAVAGAGDLSGDGVPDIIATGFEFSDQGDPIGCVRVYCGADGALLRVISSTQPGDGFGFTLAPLPDIDGDGIGEFAVGAPIEDVHNANGATGRVYVFSGASISDTVMDDPISSALYTIENDDPNLLYFGVVVSYDDDAVDDQALLIGGVDPESLGVGADILFFLNSYELNTGSVFPIASAPPKIVGDVTGDGVVDDTDLELVVTMLGTIADNEPLSGDANSSGIVLSDDVALVASSVGTKSPVVDIVPNASPILSRIFELTSPAGISGTAVSGGQYSFLKEACIIDKPRALGGDCGGDDSTDTTDTVDAVDGTDTTDDGADGHDCTDAVDGTVEGGTVEGAEAEAEGAEGSEGNETSDATDGSDGSDGSGDCNDDTDYEGREVNLDLRIHLPKSLDPNPSPTLVPKEQEVTRGSQTWINIDNDDRDENYDLGTLDTDVSELLGDIDPTPVDDDLVKLDLLVFGESEGIVTLTASQTGGQVLIWYDERKLNQYESGTELVLEEDFTGGRLTLWAEGIVPSVEVGDVVFKLRFREYEDDGTDDGDDGEGEAEAEAEAEGNECTDMIDGGTEATDSVDSTDSTDGGPIDVEGVDGPVDGPEGSDDEPREGCDTAVLTVLAVDEIRIEGNGNSFTDTNELDADPNWPSGLGTGADRVFPGARFNGSGIEINPRDRVTLQIALNVAPHYPVMVKIHAIDMDDPSAFDDSVDKDIFANGGFRNSDNRTAPGLFWVGSVARSRLVTIELNAQETPLEYQVNMKPGDNVRFVASISEDDLINPDIDLDTEARKQLILNEELFRTHGLTPEQSSVLFPDQWTSKTLTTWRNVWMELDSMGMVDESNVIDTTIKEMEEDSGVIKFIEVHEDLFDGGAKRFEPGTLIAGGVHSSDIDTHSFLEILGNDSSDGFKIWPLSFEITSSINPTDKMMGTITGGGTDANPEYTVTGVSFDGDSTDWDDFIGGQISVANSPSVVVISADPANGILPASLNIPVRLLDDDLPIGTDLHAPLSGRLQPGFAKAYIHVRLNELPNPTSTMDFQEFSPSPRAGAFDTRSYWSSRFWVRYIYTGFQDEAVTDLDPMHEPGSYGVAWGRKYCEVYRETIRDNLATLVGAPELPVEEVDIVLHEIGHTFDCEHTDNGVMGGSDGVGVFDSIDFSDVSLDRIRNRSR